MANKFNEYKNLYNGKQTQIPPLLPTLKDHTNSRYTTLKSIIHNSVSKHLKCYSFLA